MRSALPSIILLFHEVESAAWFRSAITAIGSLYRFVTMDELLSAISASDGARRGLCHITFDDGHLSYLHNAYPVLSERRIPSTVFFSPDVLQNGRPFWFQVRQQIESAIGADEFARSLSTIEPFTALAPHKYAPSALLKSQSIDFITSTLQRIAAAKQLTIAKQWNMTLSDCAVPLRSGLLNVGAHTLDHPILANESPASAEMQIAACKASLETLFGRAVKHFAYPNGKRDLDYGDREIAQLQTAGYEWAFTTHAGYARAERRFEVPRVSIDDGESIAKVLLKCVLANRWDRLRAGTQEAQRWSCRRRLQEVGAAP
jgi:peptidoglycan/xylan/chitin deacetylase (PgdA/CDA1 family)